MKSRKDKRSDEFIRSIFQNDTILIGLYAGLAGLHSKVMLRRIRVSESGCERVCTHEFNGLSEKFLEEISFRQKQIMFCLKQRRGGR